MTQSLGNNFFDGSDIQRYHSGQMTAEERHALEKAALDDPFLADALEGYTYTPTPTEDLASLRSRLEQKTNRRKVVPLLTRTWIKVAAVLFVVAGGVWLLLNTQSNSNDKMAIEQVTRKENAENKVPAPQPITADSAAAIPTLTDEKISDQSAFKKTSAEGKVVKVEVPLTNYATALSEEEDKLKSESFKESNNQFKSQNYSTQPQKDFAGEYANNNRNSRSINDMNRTMPQVNVQDRLSNNQVNANRVRSWSESDSVPAGFIARQRAQSDTETRLNVTMTPQPSAPLNEVVVSKSVAKKETDMKGRMAGIVIDTLEPAEGWTNFDDYVAGNLKVPDELKFKPVDRGEVELSFEVNQKGEPVNITVIKSLCAKCDEEAKRLLKEGPKWKKKKNNKGKVTIRF